MKNASIILMFIVLIILLGCSECRNIEIINTYYSNWEEVEKSGSSTKDWLPSVIYYGSTEIYKRHDLDSNKVWGSAIMNASRLNSICRNNQNSEISNKFEIYSNCFSNKFEKNSIDNFCYVNDDTDKSYNWYFAVDKDNSIVYFMRSRP